MKISAESKKKYAATGKIAAHFFTLKSAYGNGNFYLFCTVFGNNSCSVRFSAVFYGNFYFTVVSVVLYADDVFNSAEFSRDYGFLYVIRETRFYHKAFVTRADSGDVLAQCNEIPCGSSRKP